MFTPHARADVTVAPTIGATVTVAVLGLTHTAVDAVAGSVSALLPTLDDRFELSGSQLGTLVATISVSSLLAQPLAGRVADRIGPKKVAVVGALVSAVLLALLGSVGHIGLVYALMVAGGLGSAGFHPAAAVIARRLLPDRTQLTVSVFSAGGMLGLAFGPLVVLLLAAHAGLRFTPLLMIPGVALATVLWFLLPDDPAPGERRRVTSTSPLLHGPIGPLVLTGTLAAIAVTTFNAGMPLWLTRHGDIAKDSSMIGWTLALFELAAAGGSLASGWAAARITRGHLVTVSMLGAPIALGLTLTAAPGSFAFYGSTSVAGALANAAFPLLIVAAQDRAPGAVAAASGMLMGFSHGLAGIAFVGVGALGDAAGLRIALLAGFATMIPAAMIAGRAVRRSPAPPEVGRSVKALTPRCGCSPLEPPLAA